MHKGMNADDTRGGEIERRARVNPGIRTQAGRIHRSRHQHNAHPPAIYMRLLNISPVPRRRGGVRKPTYRTWGLPAGARHHARRRRWNLNTRRQKNPAPFVFHWRFPSYLSRVGQATGGCKDPGRCVQLR